MKITKEVSLENFEAWSGGEDTLNELTSCECEQLETQLEELYPDGMDETQLNDILWFERDWIAECLGYKNWEHLERDHSGESDEDHARTFIKEKFPNATDELIDWYIEEQWDEDDSDDTILEEFEEYKKANKAWNGCAQAHAACQRMWGSDYHELYNQLTEEE